MPSAGVAVSWSKGLVFLLAACPLAYLVWAAGVGGLGPDPAKALVDHLGLWALRLLWLCLAMTPLRLLTHKSLWIRYRRMLGLWALCYALLHILAYTFLLFELRWHALAEELTQRPYIIVGALALLLMLPLGITSTQGWQRRLGRRWVYLHRLIYPLAILVLLHFTWVQKLGFWVTWPYALLLAAMLFVRLWSYFQRSAARTAIKH